VLRIRIRTKLKGRIRVRSKVISWIWMHQFPDDKPMYGKYEPI
jgi:hypothetical protein